MCDGPIFWRQKWEPLMGKFTKSIIEANRLTSKENSFVILLLYLKNTDFIYCNYTSC